MIIPNGIGQYVPLSSTILCQRLISIVGWRNTMVRAKSRGFLRVICIPICLIGQSHTKSNAKTTINHAARNHSEKRGRSHHPSWLGVSSSSWGYPNSWLVYFIENPTKMESCKVVINHPSYGGFHKWSTFKMDGFYWKILVKWMMTGGTPVSGTPHMFTALAGEVISGMFRAPCSLSLMNTAGPGGIHTWCQRLGRKTRGPRSLGYKVVPQFVS